MREILRRAGWRRLVAPSAVKLTDHQIRSAEVIGWPILHFYSGFLPDWQTCNSHLASSSAPTWVWKGTRSENHSNRSSCGNLTIVFMNSRSLNGFFLRPRLEALRRAGFSACPACHSRNIATESKKKKRESNSSPLRVQITSEELCGKSGLCALLMQSPTDRKQNLQQMTLSSAYQDCLQPTNPP